MRRGIGLIQALIVIVMISFLIATIIQVASVSTEQTTDIYLKESLEIFSRSVPSLAIYALSAYDRQDLTFPTTIEITSYDGRFKATVKVLEHFLKDGKDRFQDYSSLSVIGEAKGNKEHGLILFDINVRLNSTDPKNKVHGDNIEFQINRKVMQRL